ncbi:MAG: hypothetical protein FJ117_02075 [Deltaproteobacteria bacterium]|nr:hypothetical protein [Deltaproteobacteria bacterium]
MGAKDNSMEKLAAEIRTVYEADSEQSEVIIETFLKKKWKDYPHLERLNLLQKLSKQFEVSASGHAPQGTGAGETARLLSLLLGKRVSMLDLSSEEFLEKLARSLNTVFDTLNQIIGVIHSTLWGKQAQMETIRLILGSNLEGKGQADSLQNYLDQIKDAFLVSHRAFRLAAHTKVGEVLKEIDPKRIAAEAEGGLEFGPLRKAKLFDIYKEKFLKCKSWHESGRFLEDLLREFEKDCQKLYMAVQRGEHEKIS